jgi:hypothetical protein
LCCVSAPTYLCVAGAYELDEALLLQVEEQQALLL